ncbi:MAG: hypothetical protein MSC30_16800 [Gaiellaceae bacterium MAG52_C11]|nr:hypothetical protein [Candidatus Gaiellasilicea maunaloa]
MNNRSVARLAVLAVAVGTLWPAAAAPASVSATDAACGTFNGPGWTRVDPTARPVNQSGTAWRVIARGVSCSFAKAEAKRLVKTPFKGEAATKLKSPTGWACVAGGGYGGGGKGTSGSCSKGSKWFGWGPATPA